MHCSAEDEAIRAGLNVTRARVSALTQFEGCHVELCSRDACFKGVLESVDLDSVTAIILEDRGGQKVRHLVFLDVDEITLTVYGDC